jgi:Flp pilus assembly protein TadG
MRDSLKFRTARKAQTFIFFLLAFGLICLLCGLAIDSGVLYLAKARLSRAVDGAALQAVGNSSQSPANVAVIMRNFAIANYSDLSTISITPIVTTSTYYNPSTAGQSPQTTYTFADGSTASGGMDSNGNYRRYVQIVFQLGSGGQITSALCNARCPVTTYFMGFASGVMGGFSGVSAFKDLKVSSSAIATRNPRLIMVVVDRSASMLATGGGAYGLPAAVITFLNFFDTSSDYIGLVSFSSSARLEMPLTTNFLNAGTNDLYDTYQINTNVTPNVGIPGVDPEEYNNVANFTQETGTPIPPRRMKFGGQTAADEGLRLAMEQLMSNTGFTNPNVVKYIVLFTDGAWNTARTMLAAPGYTNVISYPSPPAGNTVLTPALLAYAQSAGVNVNPYLPVPTLSPEPYYSNSVTWVPPPSDPNGFDYQNHESDTWQSADGINEPVTSPHQIIGNPSYVTNSAYLLNYPGYNNIYTPYLNVWLPPGSVDYVYSSGVSTPVSTYVSNYNNPTNTVNITLNPGQSNVLVVPGYVVDGIISDALDLPYPDDSVGGSSAYPSYRADGFNVPFMWPDDTNAVTTPAQVNSTRLAGSYMRSLMFRNYVNLLTGYYIIRPDEPSGPSTSTNSFTGAVEPLYGNGAYYPGAGFYFPFDLVGVDYGQNYALVTATSDPDPTGIGFSRHLAYSINMLSPAAAPGYAGELFYVGTGGTSGLSGTSPASSQITSASQWKSGALSWITKFDSAGIMGDDSTNAAIGGAMWRPTTFNGAGNLVTTLNDPLLTTKVNLADGYNVTGGYVTDGTNVFRNTMCYSGRPTHYFDFSTSSWKAIPDNHLQTVALPLGNWKAQEYAWHARQAGVTIYTVGYGSAVDNSECALLAKVANAVNVVTPAGTDSNGNPVTATNGNSYITGQPVGQQYYATTPADISNDFYEVGTAISGALTQ